MDEQAKHLHSDDDIIASINRIIAGDTEAFWRLVEPYQKSLRVAAYSLLRNPADAEEVVQETLLKALKHLQQLKEGQSFKSWLTRIAVNEARMRIRKSREELGYDEWTDDDLKMYVPRDRTNWRDIPSNALEQKEIWEAVQRALQTLSPRCREIFVLRDIQHFGLAEAAHILGISEAMASVRLHRARLHLREMLAPLFREPPSPWIPLQMMVDMPVMMMHRVIRCKHVIREISKYIDGELDPVVRTQVEEHIKYCRRCKILLDTTRKILYLLADGKVFLPPFPWQGARRHHLNRPPSVAVKAGMLSTICPLPSACSPPESLSANAKRPSRWLSMASSNGGKLWRDLCLRGVDLLFALDRLKTPAHRLPSVI